MTCSPLACLPSRFLGRRVPTHRLAMSCLFLAVVFGGGVPTEAIADDDDSPAAKELRELGGIVLPVAQNDDRYDVSLHLTEQPITDETLALVAKLGRVAWLNLAGTEVTDDGLKHLADMESLEKLHLERTKISDAGLKHLTNLKSLQYLNLYGTNVTDAGLKSIVELPALEKIYVWQTKVTPATIDSINKRDRPLEVVGAVQLPKPKPEAEPNKDEKKPAEK